MKAQPLHWLLRLLGVLPSVLNWVTWPMAVWHHPLCEVISQSPEWRQALPSSKARAISSASCTRGLLAIIHTQIQSINGYSFAESQFPILRSEIANDSQTLTSTSQGGTWPDALNARCKCSLQYQAAL